MEVIPGELVIRKSCSSPFALLQEQGSLEVPSVSNIIKKLSN